MDYGEIIDCLNQLFKFDKKCNIYISRKSLKHFVESRSYEMKDGYNKGEVLFLLSIAIDNVILVYRDFDRIESKPPDRIIYSKNFANLNKSIRIVLESRQDRLEICSIHFQKSKRPS